MFGLTFQSSNKQCFEAIRENDKDMLNIMWSCVACGHNPFYVVSIMLGLEDLARIVAFRAFVYMQELKDLEDKGDK